MSNEVSAVVSSAMLASDDVLDVIGEEWLGVLRQAAVFAAITGPFTDSLRKDGLKVIEGGKIR
jgi:hypothetical protein